MSDFVGRLLREPGPRLRPLLPNVFDATAPRLQTDGEAVPRVFVEQQPPARGSRGLRVSPVSAPGRDPHSPDTPGRATEAQSGQGPEPKAAAEVEQDPRAAKPSGTRPDRRLPRSQSGSMDVTEGFTAPDIPANRPRFDSAPPHSPPRQADSGPSVDSRPPMPEIRLRHSPPTPAGVGEPGSDTPPTKSSTRAPGVHTRPTTTPVADTPVRPTTTPGATTAPGASDTEDRRVAAKPQNGPSPTPVDGARGADRSRFAAHSERPARTVTASPRSVGPSSADERVPPAAVETPEVVLPAGSHSALAPSTRPEAPNALVHAPHPVRPVITSLAAAALPWDGRDPARPDAAEAVVRITIDRLEVRATPEPAAAPRSSRRLPRLSLDEYLRGRS